MTTIDNSMTGKVVLVTGATNGIGRVTAMALAQMGATVVVHGRSQEKAEYTVSLIKEETGSNTVDYLLADLASQDEIRAMAAEFKQRYDRLDVLVNNAGAIFLKRKESAEGIEMTFALNHLAYFLLTNLLLDLIIQTGEQYGEARIVNVSSGAHYGPQIVLDDIQSPGIYSGWLAYGQSKLANILFTYELARRLQGTNVTANVLHPGFVASGFAKNNPITRPAMALSSIFALSPEEGAQTSIYLASSDEVKSVTGQYFYKSKARKSSAASYDEEAQHELWKLSKKLTGLTNI
ncbi:MAG: SDR family oxidoreductase [Anaerolineae bacterium]|nr:SDR family oxidoreductase [Anaerolineae bacterium]